MLRFTHHKKNEKPKNKNNNNNNNNNNSITDSPKLAADAAHFTNACFIIIIFVGRYQYFIIKKYQTIIRLACLEKAVVCKHIKPLI